MLKVYLEGGGCVCVCVSIEVTPWLQSTKQPLIGESFVLNP